MLRRVSFSQSLIMLTLASFPNLSMVSLPQIAQAKNTNDSQEVGIPERRKPGGVRTGPILEAPDRRKPAGSREFSLLTKKKSCDFDQNTLTALIPKNLLEVTASTSPKLYFALPVIPQSTTIEFVLRDQNDQLIYTTDLKGNDHAGIMSLELPSQVKGNFLKSNQEYHWYLSVICNSQDRAHDIVLEGLLKRVELNPTVAQKLAQADPLEKVKLYQSENLWQETLSTLVELKRSRPNDPEVLALLAQMLNSVELDEAIAKEPLTVNSEKIDR